MSDRPAIIIFGAAVRADGGPSLTMRRRVMAAAAFGRELEDPLYVPTGGQGRFGPPEAEIMTRLLQDLGVPGTAIRPERQAKDTLQSARLCAALLRDHDGPIFAASSGYHLPRCLMLLRLHGLPARPVPPPEADFSWRDRWWWRLREGAAYPYDAAIALWTTRLGRG